MARKQGQNTNVNWGICTNTSGKADGTPCSKCQNKEKQTIRASKEFVCEECGEPLTKIAPPPPPTPWAVIIGAAAAVGGLGVGGYFLISSNNAKKEENKRAEFVADSLRQVAEQQRIADSIALAEAEALRADSLRQIAEQQRISDSIKLVEEAETARLAKEQRIADSIRLANSKAENLKNPKNAPSAKPSNSTVSWNGVASYSGPAQGGQPNGIGGTLTFTRDYQLDLKDGRGTMLDIKAGETIVNTKFDNGKLRQGELHRKDGTRKWFSI